MTMTRTIVSAALVLLASASARAQFLVDPTGGTVISSVGDNTAFYPVRPLGFTAQVFGASVTSAFIHPDGFVAFDSARALAPLSMDLGVAAGESVSVKAVAGQYFAVTWKVSFAGGGTSDFEFQMVLFGARTTLSGMTFLPNDVVCTFNRLGSGSWAGSSRMVFSTIDSPFPGGPSNGIVTNDTSSLLPIFSQTGKAFLFRPDTATTYNAQVVSIPGFTPPPPPPVCRADFNNSGSATTQDIFDFLNAWFAGCP